MIEFKNLYPNESERLRAVDKSFKAGTFFSEGFKVFQSAAGSLIGFTLLYVVIAIAVGFVAGLTGSTTISSVATLLIAPVVSGLYLIAYTVRNYESPSFEAGFGFTKQYLPLIGVEAVHQVLGLLLLFVLPNADLLSNPEALEGLEPEELWAVILDAAPILVGVAFLQMLFRILFMFAPLYVLFYNMGTIRALQESWNLVSRHVGSVLLFLILSIAVYLGGALLCGIGIVILSVPIVYAATYCAFEYYGLFPNMPEKDYLQELIG